jgi:hypothetical protein
MLRIFPTFHVNAQTSRPVVVSKDFTVSSLLVAASTFHQGEMLPAIVAESRCGARFRIKRTQIDGACSAIHQPTALRRGVTIEGSHCWLADRFASRGVIRRGNRTLACTLRLSVRASNFAPAVINASC